MADLSALLIDDDPEFLDSLELLVRREGFRTRTAGSAEEARRRLEQERPDVVLADLELPDGNGWHVLQEEDVLRSVEVIVITGHASVESAVEALQQGALDYLVKPFDRSRLKSCLKNVARTRSLKREISDLRSELRELGHFGPMIGSSPAIQRVFDLVGKVAPTEVSVLVTGESGVGKELVAQTIHKLSKRRDGPLLPVNCGAIPPNLIESELFGHERGSFTGAERSREGCFERARGGTLFLDEITEMPVDLQVKLLRVLESRSLSRVGGHKPIEVDVRVIAATNRDARASLEDGQLREDLYYRLNVFPIEVPPLREREGDVRLLAEHFLEELNHEHGSTKVWNARALEELESRTWRGNVRELRNAVCRAFIMAEDTLSVDSASHAEAPGAGSGLEVEVGSSIADMERRLIEATLEHFGGDKTRAAKALGISVKTLYNRLNVYAAGRTGT